MNNLLNLLSSDGYTPVNKVLAKSLGFVVAGYLGELIRQRQRFFDLYGTEEFYFSQSQMEEELGFSKYEQSQAVKKLSSLGFLKVEKKGIPCKYHFILCDDNILAYIKEVSSGQKTEPLVVKKLDHLQGKNGTTCGKKIEPHNNNINKEIIIKNNNNNENFSNSHLQKQNKKSQEIEEVQISEEISEVDENKNYIAAIGQKSKSFFDIFENEITESFIGMLKVKYSLSDEQIKDIANNFILYRTEKNPNGKKERWEMQKTFDIKRRFYTWLNNDKRYNKRPQDTTGVVIIG